jgi:8-oxo-dGTP pyrophosphatase MutT (NUDIX family)
MLDPVTRGGRQHIPRPDAWRPGAPPPWPPDVVLGLDELLGAARRTDIGRPLAPQFVDARPAAVLIALAEGDAGVEVLLTKRSMALRSHRGEISFPGGRIDVGESPVDAALREAGEEVGLEGELVEFHGELDHVSTFVSKSYIVPLIATLPAPLPLTPASGEVDAVLWVPIAELTRADAYREERWGHPPLDRPVHFFELEGETVWGATARMLFELLSRATDRRR